MNGWMFAAGLLALLTAFVHTFAGGKEVVRPLIAADVELLPKKTLHVVWHLVTVFLFLSALALLWTAWQPATELVVFIGLNYLLFAGVFLIITLSTRLFSTQWQRRLFRLPQWTLLLPIGLLCFMGVLYV